MRIDCFSDLASSPPGPGAADAGEPLAARRPLLEEGRRHGGAVDLPDGEPDGSGPRSLACVPT